MLEHKWYLARQLERDVSLMDAAHAYFTDILAHRRDEDVVVSPPTTTIAIPIVTDWRDLV